MRIIPGNVPVLLDGKPITNIQYLEVQKVPATGDIPHIYVTINIRLDHAEIAPDKIELSSYTE